MILPLGFALAACALTLAPCLLFALVQRLRGKPARRLVVHSLWPHALLFVAHALLTLPLLLGWFVVRGLGTRGDESAYAGPRLLADGGWAIQTAAILRAERTAPADPAVRAQAEACRVAVPGADGADLCCYRVPALQQPPRAVVLLVHGLFRGALELEPPAAMFRRLGCECWLVEQRNHGRSQRAPMTFGLREAADLERAAAFARERSPGVPLVLFGVSFGSVAVALASPRIPDLAAIVLDAPVADVLATATRMLAMPPAAGRRRALSLAEPFASLTLAAAQGWSSVQLSSVQPQSALTGLRSDLPILLVGGERDDKAPADSVRALFAALPMLPGCKRLWIAEGAGHGDAWLLAAAEYERQLALTLDLAAPN